MDNRTRLLKLMNLVADFSFGTLWWVGDTVWAVVKSDFCIKTARKRHPGCSLGRKNFTSLYQSIPMLLGSHSLRGGFPVDDLSEHKKAEGRRGYLALRPYNIALYHAVGAKPDIERNIFKPELTEGEKKQLKNLLHNRGIDVL